MINTLVYEYDHLVCIYQLGEMEEAMFFSFFEMSMHPQHDNRIWVGVLIKKLGYLAFGFVVKSQNWFPVFSMMKEIGAQKIFKTIFLKAHWVRLQHGEGARYFMLGI